MFRQLASRWFRSRSRAIRKNPELTKNNRDGIAIEKTPDALDEVQLATERVLAICNLNRESHLLRNIRAALRRNDDAVDCVLHPVPGTRRAQSQRRRRRSLR